MLLVESGERYHRSLSLIGRPKTVGKQYSPGTDTAYSSVPLKEATIPAGFHKLFKTKHDYGLNTVAQPNAGGTSRYWPRGALSRPFPVSEITRLTLADPSGGVFGDQPGC